MVNNKTLSRLEKFLYAICSLNMDELPIPLSRIEILWNCFITGDTSVINFEPSSRYERYLMAILGLYDLEAQVEQRVLCTENNDVIVDENENRICLDEITSGGIPAPISRIEKLLYKLATGDDDLDGFDTFLSKHEELLAEIIRNGGVGGNIDIEYVLYTLSTEFNTLYNTAEKPVKSAILKGVTKYRDKDTGEILEEFDTEKNLELVSVEMPVLTTTGKNLLPRKTIYNNISFRGLTVNTENNRVRVSGTATGICDIEFFNINTMSDDEYIKVKPNTKYILSATLHSGSISGNLNLACKSIADDGTIRWLGSTFTTNSNESKVNRIRIAVPLGFVFNDAVISLQLEETTVATSYEPYKSNILTVNEEVELCGIGDIKDELDLLTGELVQKTEKIIFDGSEAWEVISSLEKDNTIFAQCYKYTRNNTNAISNMLDYRSSLDALDKRGFRFNHFFQIRLNKNEISNITNNAVKEWVSKNNINVVRVEEQTVKTVDLSVVDQDGNDTKLSTFNDITHVTLSSEGLIPKAELEVATKNEEVLNTMSLEMDDISTTQNDLQETSNTQSENVDATMMATTEIYEGLL